MFIIFKKKNIILTFFTLILAFCFLYTVNLRQRETVSAFSTPIYNKVIVIDPGHGGIDAGASGNGIAEKDINLEIARFLKAFIEENGGRVIMTRKTDTNTADPNRSPKTSQKKSDLEQRKNLPSKVNADIFVSIHMNKFTESKYKGAQVFCAPASPESKALGEAVQSSLIKNADPENTRKLKDGKSIYILKAAKIPSILVECGFLSNPDEAKLLTQESYQQKIAWSIFMGITEYLAR